MFNVDVEGHGAEAPRTMAKTWGMDGKFMY
jgi:hypothetical protein